MNRRLLLFTSYWGYFLVGLLSIILPAALPLMIDDFRLTLAAAGVVFSARAAGSLAGVFMGGVLYDKLGRKPLVVGGCAVQALALAAASAVSSWAAVLVFFAVVGLAGGFMNTALNALVSELNTHRRGAALNLLHGIYGLGSLIGPVLAGLAFTLGWGWRPVFFLAAGLWMAYALALLPLPFPAAQKREAGPQRVKIPLGALLACPTLLLLFAISFIYNGAATSLVGWINTYMGDMAFSALLGAGMLTVFYTGLTAGRFACSLLSDRLGYARMILICAAGSLLFYPLAVFTAHPALIALGVFFAGFFFSGLHPTGLAWANRLFPESAGTVSGILATAMSLGAMTVPWLTGLLADHVGFSAGLSIGLGLLAVLIAVALGLVMLQRRAGDAPQPPGSDNG